MSNKTTFENNISPVSILNASKTRQASIDLRGVVDRCARELNAEATLNEIAIWAEVAPKTASAVLVGSRPLQRVLLDLIANAIENATSVVSVILFNIGNEVVVSVSNDGPQTSDPTRTQWISPRLLGARRIVHEYQGRVWAADTLCGTSLAFALPESASPRDAQC